MTMEVNKMRFDKEKLKDSFAKSNQEELMALGSCYITNTTYIDSKEYADLVDAINIVLDYIYDIENRRIQEVFFYSIENVVNIHYTEIPQLQECLDKMEQRINGEELDDWELAQTLLIFSCTMDKKYVDLMSRFKNYKDRYVKEVVEEFFYDLSIKDM